MAEKNYRKSDNQELQPKSEVSYIGREAYDAFCKRFSKGTHSKLEKIDKDLTRSIANSINKVVL